jgi:hypothetical protein
MISIQGYRRIARRPASESGQASAQAGVVSRVADS